MPPLQETFFLENGHQNILTVTPHVQILYQKWEMNLIKTRESED